MSVFEHDLSRRTFVSAASASAGLAALLRAPGAALADGQDSVEGGTLSRMITNPVSIDPYNASENQGIAVTNLLFDALTRYDYQTGELVGLAAESWEANENATQYTFHLRSGMQFHNGDPVTSADFARAWNRLCNPDTSPSNPSTVSYYIEMVSGYDAAVAGEGELDLECPDDLTFVVNLSIPFADFPYVASLQCLSPVPKAAEDDFDTFFRSPIGNGPFMMDGEWVDGQYIRLKRFDGYWGEKPLIDGCDFIIFNDESAAYIEFQAGGLDLTNIPSGQFDAARQTYGVAEDGYTANPGGQCILGETVATYYLVLNCADEVLSSPQVRHAISCAINRQAICDTVWMGTQQPATGFVPPIIPGSELCPWDDCVFDRDRAASLLDEAGYPAGPDGTRGISLTLSFNSGGGHEEVMQLIQADLQAVGIDAQLDSMEWAAYLEAMGSGSIQMGRMTWGASYPTIDSFFQPVFGTGADNNYSQYSNPEVDDLIDEARQTVDDEERLAAYAKVSEVVEQDLPVVPISFYCLGYVASGRVHGLRIEPDDTSKFAGVWLDA